MPERLLSVIHQIVNFVQTKTEIALGGTSGAGMGLYLWQSNYITYSVNLILAIFFSLLTGAAGTLGGLIIKHLWEKRKSLKKDADISKEGI